MSSAYFALLLTMMLDAVVMGQHVLSQVGGKFRC